MKIVREHINEISRGGSGISAIGIGREFMINEIKSWFNYINRKHAISINYIINDNLEVQLNNKLDYLRILHMTRTTGIPPLIKFKFTPSNIAFVIAIATNNKNMLNSLLYDYKNLNIQIPEKYKNIVEDLEELNYVCVSSSIQFSHDTIVFIDLIKPILFYLVFRENGIVLRRAELLEYPHYQNRPKLIRKFKGANIDEYKFLIDYLKRYRVKRK